MSNKSCYKEKFSIIYDKSCYKKKLLIIWNKSCYKIIINVVTRLYWDFKLI